MMIEIAACSYVLREKCGDVVLDIVKRARKTSCPRRNQQLEDGEFIVRKYCNTHRLATTPPHAVAFDCGFIELHRRGCAHVDRGSYGVNIRMFRLARRSFSEGGRFCKPPDRHGLPSPDMPPAAEVVVDFAPLEAGEFHEIEYYVLCIKN